MALVARWTLDETTGLVANDLVGGYNATLVNMAGTEWSSDHIIGTGSLGFDDASSQYCRVISSPSGVGSGNFSISFWVKTTQTMVGYYTELISKGDWVSGAWTVQCNYVTGCLSFLVEGEGSHAHSSVSINDGVWHHVAGVLGAVQSKLYIDGIDQATGTRMGVSVTDGEIQFATAIFRPGRYLDGNLDDIRYFNHDLSPAEITALYLEGYPSSSSSSSSSSSLSSSSSSSSSAYPETITITLRTSGGDYSTWDAMATYVRSLVVGGVLMTNVVINVQGGATFGQDEELNLPLTPDVTDWGGHTITIQTDPSEIATTAKIIGVIWCGSRNVGGQTNGHFVVLDLICYGTISSLGGPGIIKCCNMGATPNPVEVVIENCLLSTRMEMCTLYFNNGFMNNCIMTITTPPASGERLEMDMIPNDSDFKFNNCLVLGYSHFNITIYNAGVDYNTHRNNNCFNYGSGTLHFDDGSHVGPPQVWIWLNSIENVNPHLETDAYLTGPHDDPVDIITRSAKLTALSAACLNNADPTYAPATDMIGNPRP